MLVYSNSRYVPATRNSNWYDWYERSAICAQCGKEIDTQSSMKGDEFHFDHREKSNYKFCPYCGEPLYQKEK